MAKAYYPEDGIYKPWTADMVGALALYQYPSNAICKIHLGTFQCDYNSDGRAFTLNIHTNYGYNGQLGQAQETTARFAFGNGQGTLHIGWYSNFPSANFDSFQMYYQIDGNNVKVYVDNASYPGGDSTYTCACGQYSTWTHIGKVVDTIPADAIPFERISVVTNADAEIVVGASQPTNLNAKIWVKI